jgi:predicted ATPase
LITAANARRCTPVLLPQNSFVGRDSDVTQVQRLLARHWVTVVGPAGCGKTRLALELAAHDRRPPIVVELQHAASQQATPADIAGLLAQALGLGGDGSADPAAACAVALEGQRYLLLLDNCDRVTEVAASVVGRLLALTAGICRRLDGLPLAIELAAAKLRHFPLSELAAQLEEGLGPLEGDQAGQRHRTLEAAIDWTWDLLEDDERSVLCRLAALPRTFDLELALAVTWPGADRVVLRLLDRSLISPAAKLSNRRRFRLLEPVRAYILGRTKPDIVQQVRSAHAVHHAGMAIELTQRARTDDSREAAELVSWSRLARARSLRHRTRGRSGPRRSSAGVAHPWRPALPGPLLPATRRPSSSSRTGGAAGAGARHSSNPPRCHAPNHRDGTVDRRALGVGSPSDGCHKPRRAQ